MSQNKELVNQILLKIKKNKMCQNNRYRGVETPGYVKWTRGSRGVSVSFTLVFLPSQEGKENCIRNRILFLSKHLQVFVNAEK